jgi:uncharacterized membrane protein
MLKSRNLWSGIFLGIGFVAFIDEAVFHQLLHWHHFYDRSTTSAGLISDGFFHAFSWVATVGSLFMLSAVRSVKGWMPRRWTAGMLLGIGGFQLYDGIRAAQVDETASDPLHRQCVRIRPGVEQLGAPHTHRRICAARLVQKKLSAETGG